ncbi:MAG: molybdopterin-dependent oxidoreductase [Nitrososphaerota archaeon]
MLLRDLPEFPSGPRTVRSLRIRGKVAREVALTVEEVMRLPSVSLTFDFRCLEGWTVPDTGWEGVRVAALLDLAGALPEARYAVFKSGDYTECFPLREAREMVVAYRYRGKEIPVEHGGPFRLVFYGQQCYQSIKWLEEIELTSEPVEGTARSIALSRIDRSVERKPEQRSASVHARYV